MTEDSQLAQSSGEIVERLATSISGELPKEVQAELAKLAVAVTEVSRIEQPSAVRLAQVAAAALLTNPPNLVLAKEVREDLERRVRLQRSPFAVAFRGSPAVKVVFGLGFLLYIGIPASFFISSALARQVTFLGIEVEMLALVALAGALGSIVSIMVRINDFSRTKNTDGAVLFLTGFFKPVVGTSFALFIFAVISSGLIPVAINPEKSRFFFAALAFVAGFSERFARDVVLKTEGSVVGIEQSKGG
jgi:hypothetical protein